MRTITIDLHTAQILLNGHFYPRGHLIAGVHIDGDNVTVTNSSDRKTDSECGDNALLVRFIFGIGKNHECVAS